jgi:hypothetical protein
MSPITPINQPHLQASSSSTIITNSNNNSNNSNNNNNHSIPTTTATSISQTSFIDFVSPSVSNLPTPQPPSSPNVPLASQSAPLLLPTTTSSASLSVESIDAPLPLLFDHSSTAAFISGSTSGRPSAIKLDSQSDKQPPQPHSPAKTVSPEPNIIRPPDAFRSAVDSSNQHIMHGTSVRFVFVGVAGP